MRVFGYVTNMEKLMAVADVVVGKAGPNFMFESIMLRKPIIATGCLPGQEDGNLDFIRRRNIGWVEEDPWRAVEILAEIILDKSVLRLKIGNLKKIQEENRKSYELAAGEIFKLAFQ